mmetsp:Transcript_29586/g.86174  ORF Transcript_29586/g.86174 Transcript_29586/m.86174 type:complete len:227 (-) Transcript_29586:1294-1974(-)
MGRRLLSFPRRVSQTSPKCPLMPPRLFQGASIYSGNAPTALLCQFPIELLVASSSPLIRQRWTRSRATSSGAQASTLCPFLAMPSSPFPVTARRFLLSASAGMARSWQRGPRRSRSSGRLLLPESPGRRSARTSARSFHREKSTPALRRLHSSARAILVSSRSTRTPPSPSSASATLLKLAEAVVRCPWDIPALPARSVPASPARSDSSTRRPTTSATVLRTFPAI